VSKGRSPRRTLAAATVALIAVGTVWPVPSAVAMPAGGQSFVFVFNAASGAVETWQAKSAASLGEGVCQSRQQKRVHRA
jgi:hypothetical protein